MATLRVNPEIIRSRAERAERGRAASSGLQPQATGVCSVLSIHHLVSSTPFVNNTLLEAHAQETPGHRFIRSSVSAMSRPCPFDDIR